MEEKNFTENLAEYTSQIKYTSIPEKVIEKVKECLIDFVGVSVRGSTLDHSKKIIDYVKEMGGKKEATVFAHNFKIPAQNAGLANGTIGHALQMDDGETSSIAHLGCVVISASLAISEKIGANTKELIAGIVAGYEGGIRIGGAISPSHNKRGFSPNGTVGSIAAALATGNIIGLSPAKMADAIGSAAMQAAGLEQFLIDGSMSTYLNTGHATQAGILSSLLAEKEFTGSRQILEGRKGYCRAFSDSYDLKNIVSGLGEEYRIFNLNFKPYPTCRWIHPAIDIVLSIVKKEKVNPEKINEVIIKTTTIARETTNNPEPPNQTAATLSMQYSIAVAIIDGQAMPEQFFSDRIYDKDVRRLMTKIKIEADDEEIYKLSPNGMGGKVTIRMKEGRELFGETRFAWGERENPFTKQDFLEKFQAINDGLLSQKRCNEIFALIENIESHKIEDLLLQMIPDL